MEEPSMPLIQVKMIKETFTPTEKKEIATQLDDAMVSIKEENMLATTRVDIENILLDGWDFWAVGYDDRCDSCPYRS
jgi:phenylpyruvate tautomerase PptA (4-oxalocrotonate tautomerase family)